MPLTFHAIEGERWDDLARLFEVCGGPKCCWCMAWRNKPPEGKSGPASQKNTALKAALRSRVEDGTPIGILGYKDSAPIAWCSITPRSTHRSLGGPDEPGGGGAGETIRAAHCRGVSGRPGLAELPLHGLQLFL